MSELVGGWVDVWVGVWMSELMRGWVGGGWVSE